VLIGLSFLILVEFRIIWHSLRLGTESVKCFFFLFPEWIVTLSGKDISFNKVTVSGGRQRQAGASATNL
jgi:hypothetical protein